MAYCIIQCRQFYILSIPNVLFDPHTGANNFLVRRLEKYTLWGYTSVVKKFVFLLLLISSTETFTHPVTYKGGSIFQGSFMPKMNQIRLGYTVSPKYAFVYNANYFEYISEYQDHTIGMNFLLKRWLNHDSQANLYAGIHGGFYKNSFSNGNVGHLFFMADWESRVHYTMAKVKRFIYNGENKHNLTLRYGFAPFVAGMNELQSWLIIQGMYVEDQSRQVIITPMLRFFYKNVLWEIGHSTRGQSYLTMMVHY